MSATIIDGKAVAQELRDSVRQQIQANVVSGHAAPGLAVILIGDDPASQVYVNFKKKACDEAGINSFEFKRPADTSESELLELIQQLNDDVRVHGILVQLPLPRHINTDLLIEAISPEKDVDGFHPCNIGRLTIGQPSFRPCTPKGVIYLLESTGLDISGMDAVVVGRSNIVGRPMALELLAKNCTPRICHSQSRDLASQVKQADILVAAIGRPNFIPGDWIKPGAIIMDVGINRLDSGKLTGDVDFESAREVAGYITPVPGGVGPMTIACLMENTLEASRHQTQC